MFDKNILLLLLANFLYIHLVHGVTTVDFQDGPYEPIPIKIPLKIWQQAINPTPVAKSTATIVVPIQVNENNEDQDTTGDNAVLNEEEEAVENQTEVIEEEESEAVTTVLPIVADSLTNASLAANIASSTVQSQVQGDEGTASTTVAPAVTGQVFRFPCSCRNGQCGCCTGAFLQNMNMKACGNISFVPEDFIFDVRMTINGRTVIRRRVSASDPPPICFNPRRAPFVTVCAEISNIRIRNRNAYACLDINADIGGFDVYSASFRCFGLGSSGIQIGLKPKPVSSGPKPVSIYGNRDEDADDDDDDGLFGGLLGDGGSNDDDGPFDGFGDAFDGLGDFLDT